MVIRLPGGSNSGGSSGGGGPTGAAGGSLTGTYPNPTIASIPSGATATTQAAADGTTKVATTAYVDTADALKANLASPTLTGTPTLPTGTIATTQSVDDSSTKPATTAFVIGQAAAATPAALGTAAAGSSTRYARADHIHANPALDTLAVTTDITTLNATTSLHGLLPKLGGGTSNFLRADGSWAAPTAAVSLTSSSNYISSDVAIVTAGTFVDGPSLTLAAGTWLLIGSVQCTAGSTAIRTFTAKLWDGTTTTSKVDFATFGTGGNANIPLVLSGLVSPGGSTTYKISATSTVSASVDKIAGTSPSQTNSYLVAVKIV